MLTLQHEGDSERFAPVSIALAMQLWSDPTLLNNWCSTSGLWAKSSPQTSLIWPIGLPQAQKLDNGGTPEASLPLWKPWQLRLPLVPCCQISGPLESSASLMTAPHAWLCQHVGSLHNQIWHMGPGQYVRWHPEADLMLRPHARSGLRIRPISLIHSTGPDSWAPWLLKIDKETFH